MTLRVFKKLSFAFGSVVLGGLLWGSCNQDPIFYGISLEVEPVDPRIVGMPTHIVAIGDTFYTASKFSKDILHAYKKDEGWQTLSPGLGGRPIIDLAATESHLYALTGEPGSTALYKWDPTATDADWEAVANAAHIQSIYGAKDRLFAGAGTSSFTLLYVNNNGTLEELSKDIGFLQGAVYNGTDYYLAGTGIFRLEEINTMNLTEVTGTEGSVFSGLITLEDDHTVVGVSGQTLFVLSAEGALTKKDMGATFTGAMALWKKEPKQEAATLLLLGIQGSYTSTTHGYREILLSSGTLNTDDMDLRTPGRDPSNSSVSDYDKYYSSLGKHPVMTLFQAADGILFAGTTKNGLWSYRNEQWNAEP